MIKKIKPYWMVNFSGENDPDTRAESGEVFNRLREAEAFAEDKNGYLIRREDGGKNLFLKYLNGYTPSSWDANTMRSIGVWDTPQEMIQREIVKNRINRV